MEPIQLLVNNLLYDFSQVGIPLDNVDADFLENPIAGTLGAFRSS